MSMYGFTVYAWLVFIPGALDQQPTSIPFSSIEACEAAKIEMKYYRYKIICVKAANAK